MAKDWGAALPLYSRHSAGILAYARFDQSDVLVGYIINDYEKRRQI